MKAKLAAEDGLIRTGKCTASVREISPELDNTYQAAETSGWEPAGKIFFSVKSGLCWDKKQMIIMIKKWLFNHTTHTLAMFDVAF